MITSRIRRSRRHGTVIIAALLCLLVVTLLTSALVRTVLLHDRQIRQQQRQLQAFWIGHSALQQAQLQLVLDPEYTGETVRIAEEHVGGQPAVVHVRVRQIADRPQIEIEALYPDDPLARIVHRNQVTVSDAQSGDVP